MVEQTMNGFSEFFYLQNVDELVVCVPEAAFRTCRTAE